MSIMLYADMKIGELTELKVKNLKNMFEQFPNKFLTGNQLTISSDKEEIKISPTHIQISVMNKDFNDMQNDMKKIQELLMLDDTLGNPLVVFTFLIDIKRNSLDFCKEKFGVFSKSSVGSGVKELFTYDGILCELKVEPYLSNIQCIYTEFRYNLGELKVNLIKTILEDIANDHSSKFNEIRENILK